MPPNYNYYNYSKAIANWKRDVNSGKINVAPRFRPSSTRQQLVNEVRKAQGLPPMIINNSKINTTPFPEPRVAPVVPVEAPVVPVAAPVVQVEAPVAPVKKKWAVVQTPHVLRLHRKSRKNRKNRKSRKSRKTRR
jgi:hypothetical protein